MKGDLGEVRLEVEEPGEQLGIVVAVPVDDLVEARVGGEPCP